MTSDDPTYPVLCLARDGSISVASSAAELCRCNARAWFRNRYFDDLLLYDGAARPFRVRGADLETPLAGWRRLLLRARNGALKAVLELEACGEPSLPAAKADVIRWLDLRPELWEASSDLGDWVERVSAAEDMRALLATFA